jgi:hypothetical protein
MIVANLTAIIANLALARSVNYDRKVCCKLKRTFMIVNYNPKPFIVQATGVWLKFVHGIFCLLFNTNSTAENTALNQLRKNSN